MADFEQATADYVGFFLDITDDSVEGFRALAAPEVRYRDPLMDEQGIDNVVKAMHGWFADLLDIRFEVHSSAVSGQRGHLHWHMHFRIKKLPKRQWLVDGMTRVEFDDSGKVVEVQDYWDAAPFMEAFPVLGVFARLIKRLM